MGAGHKVNTVLNRFGFHVSRRRAANTAHVDPVFWELRERNKHATLLTWETMHDSFRAVRHVLANNVPGAIVECGVWRGGSSIFMAETLLERGVSDREIFMFDTFTGMSAPTERDVTSTGGKASQKIEEHRRQHGNVGWIEGKIEDVRENVRQSRYPEQRFHLIQGKVEETIPTEAPETIALLRLDTDFYESTKHELEHLYPRLSVGGILIVDDYGRWIGAREAVDEYIRLNGLQLYLHQNPRSGSVTAVKCE